MDDSNPKVLLKDIIIDSQNTAISVMAGMLEIAQSRGTFNMEESAKIWECIKKLRGIHKKYKSHKNACRKSLLSHKYSSG